MKKNTGWLLILTLILAGVLAACGANEASSEGTDESDESAINEGDISLRFAHFLPENTAPHHAVTRLKEEVEERSEGRIEIEIYSEAVLGNEPDIYQQLQEGSVDGAFISNAELSNHSEEFSVWNMPFLMQDHVEAGEIARSDEAMALFDTLDSVEGLGYSLASMRYILTTDEPYTETSDIQNLALRHIPSPVITDWYSQLGVSSSPVPMPDVYTSYQTGVIDAVDTELDIIFANSLHEIGNHITPIYQLLHGGILMNEDTWNSLSEEDQQMFQDSMESTLEYNVEFGAEREEALVEEAQNEYGLEVHEIEDLDTLLEEASQFHDEYAEGNELMGDFINKAREITAFDIE